MTKTEEARAHGAESTGGGSPRAKGGNPGSEGRHPIRVVAEGTGLTPDLIRAWENPPEPDAPEAEVKELRERLPPQMLLLAGGKAMQESRERLEHLKVVYLDKVTDLGRVLQSPTGTRE